MKKISDRIIESVVRNSVRRLVEEAEDGFYVIRLEKQFNSKEEAYEFLEQSKGEFPYGTLSFVPLEDRDEYDIAYLNHNSIEDANGYESDIEDIYMENPV